MIHMQRYVRFLLFFIIISSVGFSQKAVVVSGYLSSNQRHFDGCPIDIISFESVQGLYFHALNVASDDNIKFRLFNNSPYESNDYGILAQAKDFLKYQLGYTSKFFLGVSFEFCGTGDYFIHLMIAENSGYDEDAVNYAEVKNFVEGSQDIIDLGTNIMPIPPYYDGMDLFDLEDFPWKY